MHIHITEYFKIQEIASGIYLIKPETTFVDSVDQLFVKLQQFMERVTALINSNSTIGIIYHPPLHNVDDISLYLAAENSEIFCRQLQELVKSSSIFQSVKKPIIGIVDESTQDTAFSIMLWATYRIAVEDVQIGFNEPNYGIFPGFGGTIITSRVLGPEKAIPFLTNGTTHSAKEGLQLGIINQVISADQDIIAVATDCIYNYTEINRRQVASRGQRSLETDEAQLSQACTFVAQRTNLLNPGINACIDVIQRSLGLPVRDALLLEATAFSEVWNSPEALAMLRTHSFAKKQKSELLDTKTPFKINKIGVIGSGMMGAGIAYQAAKYGITTIILDKQFEIALNAKEYAIRQTNKQVQLHQITSERQKEILSRIHPTADSEELSGVDLLIEAVFEDQELKSEISSRYETNVNMRGIFATNTTSIEISTLSKTLMYPERYLGMHFFSPVDRMPLIEIIRGEKTNDETIMKAVQIAYQMNKVPIIVNDGPAFFTSRIFFNYILEAITMLLEGVPPVQIEKSARAAGFSVGPLAVLDEISVSLMMHVYEQLPIMYASQRRCYDYLEKLKKLGRTGRKVGSGLYNYDVASTSKTLWIDPDIVLSDLVYAEDLIKQRLKNVMSLDSFRCLEEGILTKASDGDLGVILGLGYPPQTGGVFSNIDQIGIQRFVAQCASFENLGEQWNIPPTLIALASKNYKFYSKFASNILPTIERGLTK